MQGAAIAFRTIPASVAAVDKDAVGAVGRGFNRSAGDDDIRAVLDQHSCVQAVEVAVVPAVGITGFGYGRIVQGDPHFREDQCAFIRSGGSPAFIDPGIAAFGIFADLLHSSIFKGRRAASGRGTAAEAAARAGLAVRFFRRLAVFAVRGCHAAGRRFRGLAVLPLGRSHIAGRQIRRGRILFRERGHAEEHGDHQ